MQWGGFEEQAAEHAAGNLNAVDWCDEALKVVESTMTEYMKHGPKAPAHTIITAAKSNSHIIESKFDHHHYTDVINWWLKHISTYLILGQIAMDMQVLKFLWWGSVADHAVDNSAVIKDIILEDFEELLQLDGEVSDWECDKDELVIT
ncbi:hypothetical protein EDB19DRAFT_1824207 [Suillus lakei]|nr:hypothetical protein EDB19DRAFT_1824207 [Suillus lakei]